MTQRALLDGLAGVPHSLATHETLILDGPARVRLVRSGAVAVFCAEVEAGTVVGPRRFLFRAGAGEPLLSVPVAGRRGLRFLAVPVEDSRLVDIELGGIAGNREAAPLLETWINLAGRLLTGYREPSQPRKVSGAREVALEGGESLRPESDAVTWVEVREGSALCMGDEALPLDGLFPVGSPMWITAAPDASVSVCETESVADPRVLEQAATRFNAAVLAHLARRASREADDERTRLHERARRHADLTRGALSELASVMDPRRDPAVHETPLLSAVGAIGEALGVEMKPPANSEDLARVADPVEAIARASRVRMRRVLLSGTWWKDDCGPLLAYTADKSRRPVALVPDARLRYELLDPVERTRTAVDGEVAARLDPEAVMFYRPLPAGKLRLRDMLRFSLEGRYRDLAWVLGTGLAATLLGMLTPHATGLLFDHAVPEANRRMLVELGLALIAAAFGQTLFQLAQGMLLVRFGLASESATQAGMWDRLLSLRPAFFREFASGDLQTRATAATQIGRDLNGATLRALFGSGLALLNFALLLYYSSTLAVIAVLVALGSLAVTAAFGAVIRKRYRVLQDMHGQIYGLLIQLIGGVSKLRVAGAEPRAYIHWVKSYTKQLRLSFKTQALEDWVSVCNSVLPLVGTICLYWFGYRQLAGEDGVSTLTIGTFLAFNAAFGTFLGGATTLSNTLVGLLDTMTLAKRIEPILEAEPEVDLTRSDPGRIAGRVALERVVFRYREDGPKVLDDLSLHAEPGEFVAIVGPSGSGKSTLLRLILGFETPESGAVLYDGQDLAGLDVIAVRRQLGVVLQSGRLNTGSIFENISGGSIVSMDEARTAARDAGMEDDLGQMPMGLHTVVSEGGGNMSGGQRQRLLIARALVLRPRVLLFDEATSALDNQTQEIVSRSLARRKVTRIVIAHRLSTIREANRIYVIEDGVVAQQGTFMELATQKGVFARMMARQMA